MKFRHLIAMALLCSSPTWAAELRIGIIGCDTSHVPEFTELINNPDAKGHVAGGRVVGAFKGGSPDIPSSASRLEVCARPGATAEATRMRVIVRRRRAAWGPATCEPCMRDLGRYVRRQAMSNVMRHPAHCGG